MGSPADPIYRERINSAERVNDIRHPINLRFFYWRVTALVIRGLSEGYQRVIRELSVGYQRVISGLSEGYQVISGLSEGYQRVIIGLSEVYQ